MSKQISGVICIYPDCNKTMRTESFKAHMILKHLDGHEDDYTPECRKQYERVKPKDTTDLPIASINIILERMSQIEQKLEIIFKQLNDNTIEVLDKLNEFDAQEPTTQHAEPEPTQSIESPAFDLNEDILSCSGDTVDLTISEVAPKRKRVAQEHPDEPKRKARGPYTSNRLNQEPAKLNIVEDNGVQSVKVRQLLIPLNTLKEWKALKQSELTLEAIDDIEDRAKPRKLSKKKKKPMTIETLTDIVILTKRYGQTFAEAADYTGISGASISNWIALLNNIFEALSKE